MRRDEIGDVGLVERVVERQHRHRVPHLGKAARGRGAHLARQAVQRPKIGIPLLDRVVALPQRVVFRIRNGRRVLLIVGFVVLFDFGFKTRVLAFGLPRRHLLDGKLGIPVRFCCFHGLEI